MNAVYPNRPETCQLPAVEKGPKKKLEVHKYAYCIIFTTLAYLLHCGNDDHHGSEWWNNGEDRGGYLTGNFFIICSL